jgi:hypothetical protein
VIRVGEQREPEGELLVEARLVARVVGGDADHVDAE